MEEAKVLIGRQYFWIYISMVASPEILYAVLLTENYYLMIPFILSFLAYGGVEEHFESRIQEIDQEHPIKSEIEKVSLW